MSNRYLVHALALTAGLVGISTLAAAQGPTVIPGITGTIVTKTTHQEEYAAARLIIDKTAGSTARAFHGTDIDQLKGLHEGSPVLVHYATIPQGAAQYAETHVDNNYLNVTEGVIWGIDRPRERIAIKYGNGLIENYRLAEHAKVDLGTDVNHPAAGAERIKVTYKDNKGQPITQFFKKKNQY